MSQPDDPVKRALGGTRDLYDIATWEERTALDRAAVRLQRFLHRVGHASVILAAVLILLLELAVTGFSVLRSPLLGVLTVLSVLPALGLAAYIWYGDPTLREPLGALVVTFLLGVLFAGFAAIVNTVLGMAFQLVPVVGMTLFFFVVVGPIEEFVKWLAVRLYAFRRPDFRAVVDGAVYGAMAGLGFATIENSLFITRTYLAAAQSTGGVVLPTVGTASVRSLAGPGHVIYSAFAGYYLGLAKFNPDQAGPIVVKGLLVAALIHGTYNTVVSYLPLQVLTFVAFVVVFDGLLLAVLFRKIRRYRAAYHDALAMTGEAPPRPR